MYVVFMKIFLFPIVPPDIINSSSSGEVVIRENDNVSLHCAASGTPQPLITWRREDSAQMTVAGVNGPLINTLNLIYHTIKNHSR